MSSYSAIFSIALFLIALSTSYTYADNNRQIGKNSQRSSNENTGELNRPIHQRNTRQGHTQKSSGAPIIHQQVAEPSYHYQPFAAAPDHIKQLIYQSYMPQEPYVNPHAFFYNINSPTTYQDASSKNSIDSQSDISHIRQPSEHQIPYQTAHKIPPPVHTIARVNRVPNQSGVRYKSDVNPPLYSLQNRGDYYSQQGQVKRSPQFSSPMEKYSNNESEHQDENYQTSGAIKQLLQYQAQIPYNVLANHIRFQPEKPFIPKPLSEEVMNHSGSYPNKIFYIKANGEVFDDGTDQITNKE